MLYTEELMGIKTKQPPSTNNKLNYNLGIPLSYQDYKAKGQSSIKSNDENKQNQLIGS